MLFVLKFLKLKTWIIKMTNLTFVLALALTVTLSFALALILTLTHLTILLFYVFI